MPLLDELLVVDPPPPPQPKSAFRGSGSPTPHQRQTLLDMRGLLSRRVLSRWRSFPNGSCQASNWFFFRMLAVHMFRAPWKENQGQRVLDSSAARRTIRQCSSLPLQIKALLGAIRKMTSHILINMRA